MARKKDVEALSDERQAEDAERLRSLEQMFGRRFLSVDLVAEKLGFGRQAIIDEIKSPKSRLPAFYTGKSYLVDERDFWAYLYLPAPEDLPAPKDLPARPTRPASEATFDFVTLDDLMFFLHMGRPRLMQDIKNSKLHVLRLSSTDKGEIRILLQKALEYIESLRYVPRAQQQQEQLKEEEIPNI